MREQLLAGLGDWYECTDVLVHTTGGTLQLLQLQRLQRRIPELSPDTLTVRELNLVLLSSFLGNYN